MSTDIAHANANDGFERIDRIPVFRAFQKGIGHGGACHDPDGGTFGKIAPAWLGWQPKSGKEDAKMFQGAQCALCADPRWVIRKKKIDGPRPQA